MNRRKETYQVRKDDEYSRRREPNRQLFNPHSDHPIGFNKPKEVVHTTEVRPMDEKRKKCKQLILSLRSIEAEIEQLTVSSRRLVCFKEEEVVRRKVVQEQDIKQAEEVWQDKIRLHLSLGQKYLEILKCDLDYAEKKGLEGLCWKRAIYSLVEQFRRSLAYTDTQQQQMTLRLFLQYLEQVDLFYRRLTVFLQEVDTENKEDLDDYLLQWRRTRKYKWYTCVCLRADIARYQWTYSPEEHKQRTLDEAWRRYMLGVWLMPAKGNLYFNLSLLMHRRKDSHQGMEFHKLYWSTRSLMVRRNGFVNAREGMLVLFESNRCYLQQNSKNTISLLIGIHGMLFTKIGLDEFARTKRLFFQHLFKNALVKKTEGYSMFWLECSILSISALYNYDYPQSILTQLISHPNEDSSLKNELENSVVFQHAIDILCQISVELFQHYLQSRTPATPVLPALPHICLQSDFLFDLDQSPVLQEDNGDYLVYLEVVLQWMVVTGICVRIHTLSLWESLVGPIAGNNKISSAFWPLLVQFMNRLLSELDSETKYDLINKHFMDQPEDMDETVLLTSISSVVGTSPDLPEEHQLRGLGWVDELHSRLNKHHIKHQLTSTHPEDVRRKIKILEYGLLLVKQLQGALEYDPVEERVRMNNIDSPVPVVEDVPVKVEEAVVSLEEIEDAVLLSEETEVEDEGDTMSQLKKRREQLQAILSAQTERRLPVGRVKERQVRLNYLKERIIPGKTVLVLDTNCFIGYMDSIKKLITSQIWSIIVPLVVVTELDGLKSNAQRLGVAANQAIELLETTLAQKPKSSLRIQTSHNNFMQDIRIRSEQFTFGETDKNLDDLVLSCCLWWQQKESHPAPVCLVTGDRNLSVKARARDVEVVPVSAIMQLTHL